MERSWNFTQTVSSVHDVWFSSLLSFTLSRVYINVVAVRAVGKGRPS